MKVGQRHLSCVYGFSADAHARPVKRPLTPWQGGDRQFRGGVRWETVVVEDALGLQHSGRGKEPMQRPCKPQVRAGHTQA